MQRTTIVIATPHERYDALERRLTQAADLNLVRIRNREALTVERLEAIGPRYVFLPHWSWIIPASVHERFNCVVFHMTDLPFGRGGSPLQNLIVRGFTETKLTALRCSAKLDAGPVYLKRRLSLAGTAEQIYRRAASMMAPMMLRIVRHNIVPQPQYGEVAPFQRRQPSQSKIDDLASLDALHDHIRMLDADGYPHAFSAVGRFRAEFRKSRLRDGALIAEVRFTLNEEDDAP